MKYLLLLALVVILTASAAKARIQLACAQVARIGGTFNCNLDSNQLKLSGTKTVTVIKGKWRKRRGGLRGKLGGHRIKDALPGQPAGVLTLKNQTKDKKGKARQTFSVTVNNSGEMKNFWGKILVTVTEGTDVQTAEVEVGDICDANDCQKKSMDLPNEKWKLKARQSQPRTCGYDCNRRECCERMPDTCSASKCREANAMQTGDSQALWRPKTRMPTKCVNTFNCHASDCCEQRVTCSSSGLGDMCRYDSSLIYKPHATCSSFSRCSYDDCCEKKPVVRKSCSSVKCHYYGLLQKPNSNTMKCGEYCSESLCCNPKPPPPPTPKPPVVITPTPTPPGQAEMQASFSDWSECTGTTQTRKVAFCFTLNSEGSISGGAPVAACEAFFGHQRDLFSRRCEMRNDQSTGSCVAVKTIGSNEFKMDGMCVPKTHCLHTGRTYLPNFCPSAQHGANVCCFQPVPGF